MFIEQGLPVNLSKGIECTQKENLGGDEPSSGVIGRLQRINLKTPARQGSTRSEKGIAGYSANEEGHATRKSGSVVIPYAMNKKFEGSGLKA